MATPKDFITRYGVLIQGNSAVSSSTAQTNALQVNGGAAIAKNLIVGTTADIFGPIIARNNVSIYGPLQANNIFTVTGQTSFLSNVAISQGLLTTGITTFTNSLNVTGPSTFASSATFNDGLKTFGNSIFYGPVEFFSGGTVALGTSSLTLSGNLTVGGTGSFNSGTAATAGQLGALVVPTGGIYVGNNLYVAGTSASTSTSATNVLYLAGGAWIDKTLVVGQDAVFNGNVVFNGATTYLGTSTLSIDNLVITGTSANTGTKTSNSLYVTGGAWIDKTLVVGQDALFKGNVVFSGTATYVYSTNTVYTDNIISLHIPPSGVNGTWTLDDGKDIGFIFNNYKTVDNDSFLGWSNNTGYLEWYSQGQETGSGNFTGVSYGVFKTGGIKLTYTETSISSSTGALQVAGGISANNIYITDDVSGNTLTGRNLTQNRIVFVGNNGQLVDNSQLFYNTLTNFLSAEVGKSTTATNLAGGGPGTIPYQSAEGITLFVATGTTGFVLSANGTGAPSWIPIGSVTAGNANTATNIAGGSANQLVIQTGPGATGFIGPGNAGQFLRSNGASNAPSYVNTGNMYVGFAVWADNIKGAANGIPYQAGVDTTQFIIPGTSGSLLQSNGSTATFVSTSSILVASAINATTADKWTTSRTLTLGGDLTGFVTIDGSTNAIFTATVIGGVGSLTTATTIAGGTAGAILYQSATNVTTFLTLSGTENAILAAGTTTPKYVTQIEAKSGTASSTSATVQSLRVTSGGIGISGDSYFVNSVGVGSNVKISGTTDSSNTVSGALQVIGGAGIGANLYVGGRLVIVNDTESSSVSQGSIVTAGGIGVGKDLTVGGDVTIGSSVNSTVVPAIYSNNVLLASYTSPTITSTGPVNLDQFSQTVYRTARYTVQVVDGSNIHVTEIVVTHNGTDAYIDEYGIIAPNGELGTFSVTADGTNVTLTFNATTVSSMIIKVVRFSITA